MDEIKKSEVYYPEVIEDNPLPQQEDVDLEASQKTSNDTYSNVAISSQPLQRKRISDELISISLNTKSRKILGSFQFTQSGAIQVGRYESGETGDIKISPDGIVARNSAGETTFALDGTTGDATFKGTIEAGSIISAEISGEQITAGTITADKLDVTELSAITANLGSVTAGSMSSVTISIGTGNNVFKADGSGIYLGNATFGSAPFRVDMSGNVTASSLTLTNASIGAGSAYTGNVIAEAYIDDLSAGKITSGDIATDRLSANTLSALQASISELSAIVVNAGDIQVGGSGDGLGTIIVKNSGGTEITKLNNSGVIVRNTRGLFFESTVGGNYWVLENNASNQAVMSLPNSNQFFIKDDAGTTNLFTVSNARAYSGNDLWVNGDIKFGVPTTLQEHNLDGINWLIGYNDLNLRVQTTNRIFFDATSEASFPQDLSMFPHWGDFYATGNKNFRIPHPYNPETQWIQYASVESPEVALRIRGKATLVNGKVSVYLPVHWKLVTTDSMTTISLTPLGDCNGLYAYSLSNKKFEIREIGGGASGIDFTWELSAIRDGYDDYHPEQTVDAEAQRMVDSLVEGEENASIIEELGEQKKQKRILYDRLVEEKYEEQTGKEYTYKDGKR